MKSLDSLSREELLKTLNMMMSLQLGPAGEDAAMLKAREQIEEAKRQIKKVRWHMKSKQEIVKQLTNSIAEQEAFISNHPQRIKKAGEALESLYSQYCVHRDLRSSDALSFCYEEISTCVDAGIEAVRQRYLIKLDREKKDKWLQQQTRAQDRILEKLSALESAVGDLDRERGNEWPQLQTETQYHIREILEKLTDLESTASDLKSTVSDIESTVRGIESAVRGIESAVSDMETQQRLQSM